MSETKHATTPWEVWPIGPWGLMVVSADRSVVYETRCEVPVEWTRTDANILEARLQSEARLKLAQSDASLIIRAVNAHDDLLRMVEVYADFIRHHVKADQLEQHPYLPEIESLIERAKALPEPSHD